MRGVSPAATGLSFCQKSIKQAQVPVAGTCKHGVATFPLGSSKSKDLQAWPPFPWVLGEAGTCRHGVATFPQKAPESLRILNLSLAPRATCSGRRDTGWVSSLWVG